MPTITIDGADSKDFDDALTYIPAGRGKAKLYVSIADVAHYVERNSDLDREALSRSTSYYLSNRVVPMLSPALSENLCSLVAHKNRLAFTCEMELQTKDGKILSASFYKSIIKVDQRLTYDIAESFLDGALNRPGTRRQTGAEVYLEDGAGPLEDGEGPAQTPHESRPHRSEFARSEGEDQSRNRPHRFDQLRRPPQVQHVDRRMYALGEYLRGRLSA